MGTYEKNQVTQVLKGSPDVYKIKVVGRGYSTFWLNITKSQLQRIMKILGR